MFRVSLAVLPLLLAAPPAWSSVRVDVNYDTIMIEVQPEHVQFSGRGGSTIILNDDGTVTKESTGGLSTNSINGYVSSINASGRTAVAHYKIANGSIMEFYENDQIRQTTTIKTNGLNLCTATMHAQPGRGQKYLVWYNPTRYVSKMTAVNIVCRIRKLN